jgi:hypothetical protein
MQTSSRLHLSLTKTGYARVKHLSLARTYVQPKAVANVNLDVAPQALQYRKELESAKAAVRLASKLCQVRNSCRLVEPLGAPICFFTVADAISTRATPQTVQLQLSAEERSDKKDDSPVTVADYGRVGTGSAILRPLIKVRL